MVMMEKEEDQSLFDGSTDDTDEEDDDILNAHSRNGHSPNRDFKNLFNDESKSSCPWKPMFILLLIISMVFFIWKLIPTQHETKDIIVHNENTPVPAPIETPVISISGKPLHYIKEMNDTHLPNKNMLNEKSQKMTLKPSKSESKSTSNTNDDVLIEVDALNTNTEHQNINILSTDITTLYINSDFAVDSNAYSNLNGPHSFHLKYPKLPNTKYETNEIRKFCFYFSVNANTQNINAAQIEIIFNEFKLEPGFDKIILRHFNDSFVDPPISFVGKVTNFNSTKYPNAYSNLLSSMKQIYYLYPSESKSICIEFQSDDSIVDDGFDININVKYDTCEWTPWHECRTMDLVGKKWSRGPMSNGKCGVGITKKERIQSKRKPEYLSNGYIDCSLAMESTVHSTEFCIKAPCSNYDLSADKDFPPNPMPGWAWYNFSRYYNGVGRYDPVYPDPFRLYLSQNNHSKFDDLSKRIEGLIKELSIKMKNISDDHYHPNVLKFAIQSTENHKETTKFLGARVVDSLLLGRPFIMAVTGDSVTSGHDNMQESTYAMQTQSRLREFWVKYGVKGSGFQIRNIAEGGGVGTNTQGFMPISMATENYDYFSKLYDLINNKIEYEYQRGVMYDDNQNNHRFMTAGFPTRSIDVLLWEFHFTDGHANDGDRELHLREGAMLNAIWGNILPIGGIKVKDSCKDWNILEKRSANWRNVNKGNWNRIMPNYVDKMGSVYINPDFGMQGACDILLKDTIVSDPKYGDNGQTAPGQMYGYTSYWLKANWHPNTRGHRITADILSYWILESAHTFLLEHKEQMLKTKSYRDLYDYLHTESGDWRSKIVDSVKNKKDDEFVKPSFCGDANGKCKGIPFALTSYRPKIFNTHYQLNDYLINKVPMDKMQSDIGWKFFNDDSIVSMELKTGAPGNMDAKFRWAQNNNFYVNKYKEFKGGNDVNVKDVSVEDMDAFEAYLIKNELYLQFVVRVPDYGQGIVELFSGYHCENDGKSYDAVGNAVHKYITKVGEEGIGKKMKDVKESMCRFEGLELGQKYKVTIVAYDVFKSKEYGLGFLFAY